MYDGGVSMCVHVCRQCMCMGYSSHVKRSQDSLKCQPSVSIFSESGSLVHTVYERLADPGGADQSSASHCVVECGCWFYMGTGDLNTDPYACAASHPSSPEEDMSWPTVLYICMGTFVCVCVCFKKQSQHLLSPDNKGQQKTMKKMFQNVTPRIRQSLKAYSILSSQLLTSLTFSCWNTLW